VHGLAVGAGGYEANEAGAREADGLFAACFVVEILGGPVEEG